MAFMAQLLLHNSILFVSPYYGIASVILILLLIVLNILGIGYSSRFNEIIVAIDLIAIAIFAIFGLPYLFTSGLFTKWLGEVSQSFSNGIFGMPELSWQSFTYAVTLSMVSHIGIESISQAAEETKYPERVIPKASKRAIVAVVIVALSLSLLSVTIVPWQQVAGNSQEPLVIVAKNLPIIGPYFFIFIGIMGALVCYVSTNTGVVGVSRVTFSMGRLGLMPKSFLKQFHWMPILLPL
jgi:APA family basic amino acid/polyamine antiporter